MKRRRHWVVMHVVQQTPDGGLFTMPVMHFWLKISAAHFAEQMNAAAVYGGQTRRWARFGYYVDRNGS